MILQGKSGISSNEYKLSKVSHLKRGRKDGDFVNDDIALAKVLFENKKCHCCKIYLLNMPQLNSGHCSIIGRICGEQKW